MAKGNTYTRSYSDFIGVDLSSDPKAVSPNRLAYSVNMWRDYESEQGAAIETFPGFRRLVNGLGTVHGLYNFRAKDGNEYLVVHAGTRLYSFEVEGSSGILLKTDATLTSDAALPRVTLADWDSTGFIFNNKLYILDGTNFIVVSSVTDQSGATSVTASEVDAYIPTTYLDGKPYEQRNMLVNEAYERTTVSESIYHGKDWFDLINSYQSDDIDNGICYTRIAGFKPNFKTPHIYCKASENCTLKFDYKSFENEKIVKAIDASSKTDRICFNGKCFKGCENLETITLYIGTNESGSCYVELGQEAFEQCNNLKSITINIASGGFQVVIISENPYDSDKTYTTLEKTTVSSEIPNIPDGVEIEINANSTGSVKAEKRTRIISSYDKATSVRDVRRTYDNKSIEFEFKYEAVEGNSKQVSKVTEVRVSENDLRYLSDESNENSETLFSGVVVLYELDPLKFSTIENVKNFRDGNPDYRKTGVEAINGCTKSAVFDGRIFLTGNPELPNTVFYSNRNLTGANDPTYFGVHNYFNDCDGNTPNVDLLSTPSMLMVLKNNTVQDGSVYYHVGAYNEDEYSKDLVPRIYPATTGAAGLGSAGVTIPGTTAYNFLDDPVFLSTRGLEAVVKQTVNLERTLTHRSSNVDRLLIKEDLSKASMAEWKGYLVICCEGNFYLADSRILSQHADGSYQYEWYYLEGLGTYDNYKGGFRYVRNWYPIDESGKLLSDCKVFIGGAECELDEYCKLADANESFDGTDKDILVVTAIRPDESKFDFYVDKRYDPPLALETVDEERSPADGAIFYPATKIAVIGELLFFGTANGDVCVINTDKRGVPDYEGQQLEHDRISTKWYSFNGIAYPSICVTRLDDCAGKSLSKATVPGTTVARFKMMPGSKCRVEVSLNGRDFKKIGEAFASRYDAGDLRFDNFAFAENENSLVVLRELTRNWVDKQYSFISEGFREPFGLYELSYLYYVKGKIRRI